MSFLASLINSMPGAVAQGLIWGIMAIGVYLTYRILDVADLTVDGSLGTGGAVCVVLVLNGVPVGLALVAATAAGMLAGLVISTTKVGEFLSAMARLHIPKKLTIPIAVMLRYLPTIREDWHYIKDAMRLRDVSPTLWGFLKAPAMTITCIYVPLLTAASKAADELSIASMTRGIENPKPRTCLINIQMQWADLLALVLFAAFLVMEIVWKTVGV